MLYGGPKQGAMAMRGIVFIAVPITILLWFGLYEFATRLF